jgi:Ca2+-binding RTX toxin-like protein
MLESLESRRLFSIAIVDGVLTVRGTTANEKLSVAWKKTSETTWDVRVFDGRKKQNLSYSSDGPWNAISIYGGNGADYLSAAATISGFTNTFDVPVPVTMNGGAGDDRLHGSESIDVLLGGSGNDSLFGHGGGDDIFGEGGRDYVEAGIGDDDISGGDNDDTVVANAGEDTVTGGSGNDLLDAGGGDDLVSGNSGADALFAGTNDGTLFFRGPNTDLDQDTLFGSTRGESNDPGDEIFL